MVYFSIAALIARAVSLCAVPARSKA